MNCNLYLSRLKSVSGRPKRVSALTKPNQPFIKNPAKLINTRIFNLVHGFGHVVNYYKTSNGLMFNCCYDAKNHKMVLDLEHVLQEIENEVTQKYIVVSSPENPNKRKRNPAITMSNALISKKFKNLL